MNLLFLTMPVFAGALLAELLGNAFKRRWIYPPGETFSNLACAFGAQLVDPLLTVVTLAIYTFAYDHWRVATPHAESWITWILAIVAVDFTGYWEHRLCHETNFMWALHVVHHQSEEYNLTVGLRVNWLRNPSIWLLDLPLAVMGIPPGVYLAAGVINQVYQFILHTRAVGKLPAPVEAVLVTPSHHRVHHGTNLKYRDKNYGGIFIVWDKIFGTFAPEAEEPVYGLTKPFQSANPVWAHVHYWRELYEQSKQAQTSGDKFRVWWKNPGWQPGDLSKAGANARAPERPRTRAAPLPQLAAIGYVGLQLAALVVATVAILSDLAGVGFAAKATIYVAALTSMAGWGAILAGVPRAPRWEALRLITLTGVAAALQGFGGLPDLAWVLLVPYLTGSALLLREVAKKSVEHAEITAPRQAS